MGLSVRSSGLVAEIDPATGAVQRLRHLRPRPRPGRRAGRRATVPDRPRRHRGGHRRPRDHRRGHRRGRPRHVAAAPRRHRGRRGAAPRRRPPVHGVGREPGRGDGRAPDLPGARRDPPPGGPRAGTTSPTVTPPGCCSTTRWTCWSRTRPTTASSAARPTRRGSPGPRCSSSPTTPTASAGSCSGRRIPGAAPSGWTSSVSADALVLSVVHKPDAPAAGADLVPAYPVVVAPLGEGSWYEAGDRYRRWAMGQAWAQPVARSAWLREGVGICTFGINAQHDRSRWLDAIHAMAGTPVFHVLGPDWAAAGQDYQGRLPRGTGDWFPGRFAEANLEAIRRNGDRWAPFEFDLLCADPADDVEPVLASRYRMDDAESGISDGGLPALPVHVPGHGVLARLARGPRRPPRPRPRHRRRLLRHLGQQRAAPVLRRRPTTTPRAPASRSRRRSRRCTARPATRWRRPAAPRSPWAPR